MIYAIVNILGKQFKLIQDKYVYIPKYSNKNIEEKIFFKQVFLFYKNGEIQIGKPFLKNIHVEVKILKHLKGKKIIIFKKKRRKGYKVKNGFRPSFTKIQVISFLEK
ncbi:50S ribosomal protein L21 [Blattabacterium cuenoti]